MGVRVHSGWGALVVVSGEAATVEVIERRRIVLTDPQVAGANQPYHWAAKMGLLEAEEYVSGCAVVSERLALVAAGDLIRELHNRDYEVKGVAVLLASGRALPALSEILASHALIHTAEGEFFRKAFWRACERLEIPVTALRERDLEERAQAAFGKVAAQVQRRISTLGRFLGPPWTEDQKKAAVAASIVLTAAS